MTSSLVGSEMCIRDRRIADKRAAKGRACCMRSSMVAMSSSRAMLTPVSYTHLTLPTICSV
eukprot:2283548-Prorocentrum_lima.AAC.1